MKNKIISFIIAGMLIFITVHNACEAYAADDSGSLEMIIDEDEDDSPSEPPDLSADKEVGLVEDMFV